MQTVSIEGKIRDGRGKKANKDLRGGGLVPAVIYGGDTNITFSAPASAFRALVYTPDFHVAEITVAGKTYRAFVKELQSESDRFTALIRLSVGREFDAACSGEVVRAAEIPQRLNPIARV